MTRRQVLALIAVAVLTSVASVSLHRAFVRAVVLTPGPCTMLGIAELADHPGAPFLVIDCDGFQFGVPAVLP